MTPDTQMLWYEFPDLDSMTVYPIADVHLGAEGVSESLFDAFIEGLRADKSAYVVLAGDLIDNGTRNGVTNIFRATMPPSQQKRVMAEKLVPIRDRILCIVPGNHCARSGKDADDDPCYDIAAKLDLEDRYRENAAFIRIGVGVDVGRRRHHDQPDNPYRCNTYRMAVLHGAGGGMKPGAGLNRTDDFIQGIDGIDILITGHTHKPLAMKGSKLVCDMNNKLMQQRPYLLVTANPWLNYVGYPLQKLMRPTAMPGVNKVLLSGTRQWFEAVV